MDDDSEYFFWHPILRLTKPCKEPLAIDFGDSTSTSNLVVWAAHFFFERSVGAGLIHHLRPFLDC